MPFEFNCPTNCGALSSNEDWLLTADGSAAVACRAISKSFTGIHRPQIRKPKFRKDSSIEC